MRSFDSPLFLPALGFAAGAALAFSLVHLPVALLAPLALLVFALRGRSGPVLGFTACGLLLVAASRELPGEPSSGWSGLDRERPVEALVEVAGPWSVDGDYRQAPGEVLRLRQGSWISSRSVALRLSASGDWTAEAPYGTRLRVRGYLSRSPGLANRIATPPGPWRLAIKSRSLAEIESSPALPLLLAARLRERVERGLERVQEGEAGEGGGAAVAAGVSLARALVLGDASRVPEGWKRALRLTGTYHLLSISGLHVAWVVGLVWIATWRLPRRLRLLAGVAALFGYLALVGPQPALLRSVWMGGLLSLALFLERPPSPANALGAALLGILAPSPELALSISFQLTVAATAGLVVLTPRLTEAWRRHYRLPFWAGGPLAATVGAQLATWPFALPRFHLLTPLSPVWNLLAIPWSGAALLLALATCAAAAFHPSWAAPCARLLGLWGSPLEALAGLPVAALRPVPLLLSPGAALLLSLGVGGILLLPPRRLPLALAGAGLLILSGTLPGVPSPGRSRDRSGGGGLGAVAGGDSGPSLSMLDVGQGDALLLRDGERAALVDGGGWRRGGLGARVLLPALLAEGVTRLDALYLTHPDADHCAGLAEIATLLPVGSVSMGEGWPEAGCAEDLRRTPGVRLDPLRPGEERRLGRWRLAVLHAPSEGYLPENERSLVLAATFGGRRILLTGDAGEWAEQRLLACCSGALRADLLKVGHHGSRSSSAESFLRAVAPQLALISAGEGNLYHHPSREALARLERAGARILRTDLVGEIVVVYDALGRRRLELPGVPKQRVPSGEPSAPGDPTGNSGN